MSSAPFIFSVDLDGVVGDYEAAFRKILGKERGVDPASFPELTSWSFCESGWPFDSDDHFLDTHAEAVLKHGLFLRMPLVPGASKALWELNDAGVHIRITTARLLRHGADLGHATAVSDTVRWLDINKVPYRDLLFLHDKHSALVGAAAAGKGVLHIDDSPGQLESIAATGVPVIAMDQPYNRHLDLPRAHDWEQVKQMVLASVERARAGDDDWPSEL